MTLETRRLHGDLIEVFKIFKGFDDVKPSDFITMLSTGLTVLTTLLNFLLPNVLEKGGVAIHTTCKSDRDLLAKELPAESFGGGVKHPPRTKSCTSLYIKGVDTSVDIDCITQYLTKEGINTSEV